MSTLWVVILAVGAAAGSWWARPFPILTAIILGGIGRVMRWPLVLCMAATLATSSLAARALGAHVVAAGPFRATATLVTDPVRLTSGAIEADARGGGRRIEIWAFGSAGRALARQVAGQTLAVTGTASRLSDAVRRRLGEHHIVGRVTAVAIERLDDGAPWARAANRVRAVIEGGAVSIPSADRALFTGFVLGDDRALPPAVLRDFRASGLSHLTAVSGENVAFVLAAAGPVLRRLSLRPRLVITLAVLAFFAAVTRFEPSVLRAVVMAGLAALAAFLARPTSGIRLLALAVTVLLLIDPLLIHSVGFGLSVGASAAIIVMARPLAARLPGPRALIEPFAVTLAAQVGVLPVSLAVFGGIPLAAIPANVLAAPAAGPVMTWGLTGGLLAGVSPGPIATALHLPTRALVRWIAVVAHATARWPLGTLGAPGAAVLAAVVTAGATVHLVRTRR